MKMKYCSQDTAKMPGDYIGKLVNRICATYQDTQGINHLEGHNLPRQQEILTIIEKLLDIVFPGFNDAQTYNLQTIKYNIGDVLTQVYSELLDQVIRSFRYVKCDDCDDCDVVES